MKTRNFSLAIAIVAISTGFAFQAPQLPPPNRDLELSVRGDMFAGFAGDAAALDRAMKVCEDALARDPKNPPALVWHATGIYFRSGLAFRQGNVEKGTQLLAQARKEMDDGVALRPDGVEVLIPRATVLQSQAAHIPDPDTARRVLQVSTNDFEKVLKLQANDFANLPVHSRGELLGGLAEGWNGLGDTEKARAYLTRITKELPKTPYAEKASAALAANSLPRPIGVTCIGCHVNYTRK
jgi:tetratricopeptide (TPR) repeat protein